MLEQPPAAQPPPEDGRLARASGERSVAISGDNRGTIITGDVVPWFRSRRQQAAVGILALVLALGAGLVIYQFVRPLVEPAPKMIGGSIKIAVGGFDGVDARGQAVDATKTDDLALAVFTQLDAAAKGPGKPSAVVWPASKTGRVGGARARQRALEINADIVVYGSLRVTAEATHLQPRFYVTADQLTDAHELAGDYKLGQEIVSLDDFARNGATYDDLKNKLVARVVGLEDVLSGLFNYRRDDLEAAAAAFKSAESNKSWVGQDGKEILFLFAGFTAGKRNDLTAAAEYFKQAGMLERTRARADLGSAEVLLSQSGVAQDCAHDAVNVATLHGAASAFTTTLADSSPPPAANIRPKAHYGLGQVDICLSQSQNEDLWDDAEQQFRAVIAEYDGGNADIKSLAAESHARLGFLAQPWAGEKDPAVRDAGWARAANEYRQAIALSGEAHVVRRAFFEWSLGLAEERQGNLAQAEEAYTKAAGTDELDPVARMKYEDSRDRVRRSRASGGQPG